MIDYKKSKIKENEGCKNCRDERYKKDKTWGDRDKKPTGILEDSDGIKIRRIKDKDKPKLNKDIEREGPCPMLPAIYKKSGPIDVMLVTESHGGAVYKNNSSYRWLNNEKTPKEGYFDAGTFHAYEIRKILLSLDELKLNWYLTDLVKCYVAKKRKIQDSNGKVIKIEKFDFEMAARKCFNNYLIREIKEYKPKIIVIFGWVTYTLFDRFKKDKDILKNFDHESNTFKIMGDNMEDMLDKLKKRSELESPIYLILPFPSQSAANSWSELKTRIDKKYGIEKGNNHHPISYLLKEIKNRIQ